MIVSLIGDFNGEKFVFVVRHLFNFLPSFLYHFIIFHHFIILSLYTCIFYHFLLFYIDIVLNLSYVAVLTYSFSVSNTTLYTNNFNTAGDAHVYSMEYNSAVGPNLEVEAIYKSELSFSYHFILLKLHFTLHFIFICILLWQ